LVPTPSGFVGAVPIYTRPLGFNFTLVIEGRPGGSRQQVGLITFASDPEDPTVRPDLWILASRPLGDGSGAVCDDKLPDIGGVPATDPPDFSETQAISNRINDFACRFVNGTGAYLGRLSDEACTMRPNGEFQFVSNARAQFCGTIGAPFKFPSGDTTVTARIRDMGGNLSPPAQIIIRTP
jgi:hypothetical protein